MRKEIDKYVQNLQEAFFARKMRPKFHFSSPAGWMNDPHAPVWYRGEYHLFFNYYPYDIEGVRPKCWGHAVTKDFTSYRLLPTAIAPDTEHDRDGCASGCAVVHEDKLWLIYTGRNYYRRPREVQCAAWSEDGVKGCRRFLERVWKLQDILTEEERYSAELETRMHQTIKKVSGDYESLKYNTAIAAMMALINDMNKKGTVTRGEYRALLTLLNPVAPHITEELWQICGFTGKIYQTCWPEYEEAKTIESTVEIAMQICGKMRGTFSIPRDLDKEQVIAQAKELLGDRLTGTIVKEIYVPGKLVNIVVKP